MRSRNTAQAVLGVKSGGTEAMRLDVVRIPAEQSLQDISVGMDRRYRAGKRRDFDDQRFSGSDSRREGEQWSFRLYAISFGTDVYRFIYAAKDSSAATDREFRTSIETFRRLKVAEIQAARPLRLKIVTVKTGDTIEALHHATCRIMTWRSNASAFRTGWSVKPG